MYILSIFIYLVLFIVTGVYLFFKRQFSFFEKQGIPHLKPSIPMGNFKGIGRSTHAVHILRDLFQELKRKGKIIGMYAFTSPIYIVTDIEVVKHIMVKDFSNFTNRGVYSNEEEEPLTGHIFAIEDERWRFLRNKLSPVFTSGKLKNMFLTIKSLESNIIGAVERQSRFGYTVNIKNIASRFTVDTVSSVAFGLDANTLNDEHPEMIKIFKDIFNPEGLNLIKGFFIVAFPNLSKKLKLRQFSKNVSDFFMNVLEGNINYREGSDEKRNDFLDMLIQLKNKGSIDGEFSTENKKLTMNECLAQAFIFFFAGAETSSTTISNALIELAFNPDMQDKLRQEIEEKTKDTNGEISYEILNEMPYLNQVVNETLRMHGPVPFVLRKARNDYKVPDSNVLIKKDSSIWIPMEGFHYDDRYWKNPNKFDPERFTQEEIAKRPAMCYFPFGEGPRNCIGMRLGLMNVKFGIAAIVRNFNITPDAKVEYPMRFDPKNPTDPIGGFSLKFQKYSA